MLEILSSTDDIIRKGTEKKYIKRVRLSIYRLNPQLKEGLLKVGGRLVSAPIDMNIKHPVILPYKHHVTDLIVQSFHQEVGHMGQESVLVFKK